MGNVICCLDTKRQQYQSAGSDDYEHNGKDIKLLASDEISSFSKRGRSGTNIEKRQMSPANKNQDALEEQPTQVEATHTEEEEKTESAVVVVKDLLEYEHSGDKLVNNDQIGVQAAASPPSMMPEPIEDHLQDYEFGLPSEEEIEEFGKLRNENETDITFTKRGITEYIEQMLSEESSVPNGEVSEEKAKLWELKLDKEDIKVYVKKSGGSRYHKTHPYIKTEITFNAAFSMRKIIEAIFDPKHRLQWDKTIMKQEEVQLPKLGRNCVVKYQQNKGVLNFNHKEFVDKQIRFSNSTDGSYYIYYSAIPDGVEIYDQGRSKLAKTDRGYTIIGVQKMYRRPEDGKIVYSMLMQCDLKVNITPKIIQLFLPNGMQDWLGKCNKYINSNYEKI